MVRDPRGWVIGNLSVQGDGAAHFTLPSFRFLPPPRPPSADLVPLKPEEHAVKFQVGLRDGTVIGRDYRIGARPLVWPSWLSLQYIGLDAVTDCVGVNVTVGGKRCQYEFRGDVVVCPLPPSVQLSKDGTPLKVCSPTGPHGKHG